MQKPVIYWHIGLHKTGTTSIQHFLNKNFKQLVKNKLLYPKSLRLKKDGKVHFAHHDLAAAMQFKGFANLEPRLKDLTNFEERLLKEFKSTNCESVIISSELFNNIKNDPLPIERFVKTFSKFTIKVICYLRRQDKFLESSYKQRIKRGVINTIDEHIEIRHFNYFEKLQFFEKFVGKSNMIIKIFDDPEIKTNLIPDFLKTIGVADEALNKDALESNYNVSFPTYINHYIKLMNEAIGPGNEDEVFNLFKQLNSKYPYNEKDSSFFTAEDILNIKKQNETINQEILNHYFEGHNRTVLFKWPKQDELNEHLHFDSQCLTPFKKVLFQFLFNQWKLHRTL